ncbi:hypothetical protein OG204_26040 [Streptomyces sp. NBC_01387]|uniref:hypothetical protein n=1 Tax=unclassified Streptomyces TaxID=2593676 RepID=UPI0022571E23|nr:hypothetical protein [Streptomyces sp. NBC_01500]MCX4548195.1 hypothetical protein [Streptomyces sp. NBC_01500]WSV53877.1 hypothetical protein OG282_09195 [Streptomyces sp. NBC_01014]
MEIAGERATMKAVTWRLMPFLVLLYLVACADRSDVGFAKRPGRRACPASCVLLPA